MQSMIIQTIPELWQVLEVDHVCHGDSELLAQQQIKITRVTP